MRCGIRRACAPALALVVALAAGAAPGSEVARQRVVPRPEAAALLAASGPDGLALLEKLNRADRQHLARLDVLVVPVGAPTDPMRHAPFPRRYPAAAALPKLLVVDLAWQAFAAYEDGRLVRWGPVSSGRRDDPTPSGAFHLAWKSLGRRSTVNPRWYMPWYFNFASRAGLALHAYTLPGHPASHACVRLLPRDARWLYHWGEQWTFAPDGRTMLAPGTPVLVTGAFDFDAPPPWRSPERLAAGAMLPAALPFEPTAAPPPAAD